MSVKWAPGALDQIWTITNGTKKLAPVSISDEMSYHKISWSHQAAKLVVWKIALLWNMTGVSAALPLRSLSNFRFTFVNTKPRGFKTSKKSYYKTSYCILKRGYGRLWFSGMSKDSFFFKGHGKELPVTYLVTNASWGTTLDCKQLVTPYDDIDLGQHWLR